MTAGPIVGSMGKYKLVDDIVISCVRVNTYSYSTSYRKIFVFSPTLRINNYDRNYDYIELKGRTIYDQTFTLGKLRHV